MKHYRTRKMAERMASLRSRNAHIKGAYSQYALIRDGDSWAVGPVDEVRRLFPTAALLAQ